MNDRHAQLLAEACASAARDVPKLQRSLREKPEESAASITKEIKDFLGAVRDDRKAVQAGAEKTLHPLMLLFDVALLQVCDLSLFGLQNIDHPRKVVWPNEVFPARPRPNAVFYILTANIAHSMQAYRMLVLQGFESQARATFRSVVEVFDLMLVVLASPDKYREYITSFEDPKDAYRHWKRCLSPAKIRDVLDNLEIADPVSLPCFFYTDVQ